MPVTVLPFSSFFVRHFKIVGVKAPRKSFDILALYKSDYYYKTSKREHTTCSKRCAEIDRVCCVKFIDGGAESESKLPLIALVRKNVAEMLTDFKILSNHISDSTMMLHYLVKHCTPFD